MKNTIKIVGIIALIAVMGFSMVSCASSKGNSGDSAKVEVQADPQPADDVESAE